MNLNDIFESSKDILYFDTDEKILLDNKSFIMAWGIARTKALENMQMVNALLLLKNKYKINDFEFELFLENVDADNLFGA
jgi:hypothetical protein